MAAAQGDVADGVRDCLRGHRAWITNRSVLRLLHSARPGLCTASILRVCERCGAVRLVRLGIVAAAIMSHCKHVARLWIIQAQLAKRSEEETVVVIRGKHEQTRRKGQASEERSLLRFLRRAACSHALGAYIDAPLQPERTYPRQPNLIKPRPSSAEAETEIHLRLAHVQLCHRCMQRDGQQQKPRCPFRD